MIYAPVHPLTLEVRYIDDHLRDLSRRDQSKRNAQKAADDALVARATAEDEASALRAENARLLAERRELYDERGLLRAAVRKLLSFEASCGENDIPEEDRIFARAVLAAAKGE